MFHVLLAICLYVVGSTPALSGAWQREADHGFASATATLRNSNGIWATELGYYGDYGLTDWLTLGVDLNDSNDISGHAMLFARLPLNTHKQRHRLAIEMALGGAHYQGRWQQMYKLTLSYGYSFESKWGSGWLAIDGAYEMRGTGSEPILKLDATVGLVNPDHIRPILQVETAKINGHPLFYTVTPGLQIPLGEETLLLIGAEHRVNVERSLGLKIGVWHRF